MQDPICEHECCKKRGGNMTVLFQRKKQDKAKECRVSTTNKGQVVEVFNENLGFFSKHMKKH